MAGLLLLVAAAGLALLAVVTAAVRAPTVGGAPIDDWAVKGASASLWAAVAYLAQLVVRSDTSFAYVAEQTRTGLGFPLRLSALWAGAEGSLLLFVAIVATVLLVGRHGAPRWQRIGTALVTLGLCLAASVGANPFRRLDLPPLSGAGMAPILEHYAMVVHPPLLYTGMGLALTPALIRDRRAAHRWALAAMAVLTVALGLGSAWAYVELGWGGWWAWDPIENIGLIVWLLLAAGLHWQPLDPGRGRGSGLLSAVVLWSLCWPAVIGGAALTRTSLRTSVHAFADAAALSSWLWPLVVVATIGAGLRIWEDRPERPGPWRRQLPQAILAATAFVVATGTYRPFVGGDGTAGWFYSRTLYPLAIAGAVVIGIVPRLHRSAVSIRSAPRPLLIGCLAAAALAAATTAAGWRHWFQILLAAALGFGLGLVLTGGGAARGRLAAHLGALFIVFGALAGTASTETVIRLNEGRAESVDGHTFELLATEITSENPLTARATVWIDGAYELTPSVSVYPERNLRLPEVSTRTRPWLDTQAVLRDVDQQEGALITVLFRPWNQLVWWGVAMITVAAVLAARTPSVTGAPPS